ncbi:MAG: LON peptidase substrate-binding domain-containing protein [Bacteroidota bacterium]|nr:LON peptidase substrate-binding domain-containing protein [Bacteroidota bacterium]
MEPKILTLPMFPLNTIVLPGETTVLHIFEDRYKELIVDCMRNMANFGIPYVKNDMISEYGMEVRIKRILKTYENGELDIEVVGVEPFKILQYTEVLKPKLYGAASIEEYEDDMTSVRYKMFRSLKKYIKSAKQKEIPVETFTNVSVYNVAILLDLTNEEKIQLIAFQTLKEKEDFLIAKLKLFMHMLKTEQQLQGKFWMN